MQLFEAPFEANLIGLGEPFPHRLRDFVRVELVFFVILNEADVVEVEHHEPFEVVGFDQAEFRTTAEIAERLDKAARFFALQESMVGRNVDLGPIAELAGAVCLPLEGIERVALLLGGCAVGRDRRRLGVRGARQRKSQSERAQRAEIERRHGSDNARASRSRQPSDGAVPPVSTR